VEEAQDCMTRIRLDGSQHCQTKLGLCKRLSHRRPTAMSRPQDDRNQEATVYLVRISQRRAFTVSNRPLQGNLDERVSDAIIWELMLQAGPVGTSPNRRATCPPKDSFIVCQSTCISQRTVYPWRIRVTASVSS
jgi:hypothetical protein